MTRTLLLIALGGLAAAGSVLAEPDPDLGAAVRADQRAQIIDPDPHYRGDPAAGSDGLRSVRALMRYRLDREKPLVLPTSDTKSGAQGTVANGTGESNNGSQVITGDIDAGQAPGGRGGGGSTGASGGGGSASVSH